MPDNVRETCQKVACSCGKLHLPTPPSVPTRMEVEGIMRGLEDVKAGRVKSLEQIKRELESGMPTVSAAWMEKARNFFHDCEIENCQSCTRLAIELEAAHKAGLAAGRLQLASELATQEHEEDE